jgi:glutamate racemase
MIGFYDTGRGGQSIIDALKRRAPNLPYEFYIDSEALPLGEKSHEYIQQTVTKACEELFLRGCKLIILACNTASVHTIRYLQSEWLPAYHPDRQILGVTTPLLEFSEQYFQTHKPLDGWLLATPATCNHQYYKEEFSKRGFDFLHPVPAIGLADAIEKNDQKRARQILQDLRMSDYPNPAYIALACTHYTYAKSIIQEIFPNADIIDPTEYIVERILDYLNRHPEYQEE